MTPAVSPDQAIANYREAYRAHFGTEAPDVRKRESGGYSVLFAGGSKRYGKTDFNVVTAMMARLANSEV